MLAACTKCGRYYRWRASRGSALADNPYPCCRAPGRRPNREETDAYWAEAAKAAHQRAQQRTEAETS